MFSLALYFVHFSWWCSDCDIGYLSLFIALFLWKFVQLLVVGCGLMSHSAIFQLYSGGTIVQFSKFWPAVGHPTPYAARKRYEPTPTRAPGRPKTSITSLPSGGPHAMRVSRESNPGLPTQSPARYLYATAAGKTLFQITNVFILYPIQMRGLLLYIYWVKKVTNFYMPLTLFYQVKHTKGTDIAIFWSGNMTCAST